jgi:hypothetical protein
MDSGLPPSCWGPALWHSLHAISFGYPEFVGESPDELKLKQDTFRSFEYLGSVLPCSECREHYKGNFYNYDLSSSLNSRKDFTKWVYDLHNRVNKGTGVPESKWPSYQEVYNKYNSLRSENCQTIPGVCGASQSDVYCKVELVSKKNYLEGFSSSNLDTSWIIVIILSIFVLALAYYSYTCSGTKNRGPPRRRR